MTILSKGCKPDNFESHNSLKFSFTNIRGLPSNFVDRESFFESNSPDVLVLCETNLDDSIVSGNFSVRGYLPRILLLISMVLNGPEVLFFAYDKAKLFVENFLRTLLLMTHVSLLELI